MKFAPFILLASLLQDPTVAADRVVTRTGGIVTVYDAEDTTVIVSPEGGVIQSTVSLDHVVVGDIIQQHAFEGNEWVPELYWGIDFGEFEHGYCDSFIFVRPDSSVDVFLDCGDISP